MTTFANSLTINFLFIGHRGFALFQRKKGQECMY